jgi:hypothetical protein
MVAAVGTWELRMDDRPAEREAAPDTTAPKKVYRTPSVVIWGTLREITQSIGNHGSKDGGHGRNHRTR